MNGRLDRALWLHGRMDTYLTQACVNRRLGCALQLHGRVEAGTKCAIDEKFYSMLVRGGKKLRQLLTAVDVVRATFTEPRILGEEVENFQPGGAERTVSFGS